jgi:hypothetical protein
MKQVGVRLIVDRNADKDSDDSDYDDDDDDNTGIETYKV